MDATHAPPRSRLARSLGLAALALSLGAPAALRADAVPPPPTNCPTGSRGETCHGGPHCRPATCTTDAQCTGGAVCRELSLCVTEISCRGGWTPPDAAFPPTDNVLAACGAGGACASGSCRALRVCAPPASTGTPASLTQGGCSCHAGASGSSGLLALLGTLALSVSLRRRVTLSQIGR